MDVSVRHLLGIDQALGLGATITLGDKTHTFSPLSFKDYAEVVAYNKSQALAAYLEGTRGTMQAPGERIRDMNGLMCRPTMDDDFDQANPATLLLKCRLSLCRKHPTITDAEVDELLSNDEWRETICDVMHVLDTGPVEVKGAKQEVGTSPANPT